jgi:hypothetical protein
VIEHSQAYPALKRAMDRAIVGELFGQAVSLTAATKAEDDRVQCAACVDSLPPSASWRVKLGEDLLDHAPESVRHSPDGWQGLLVVLLSWHGCLRSLTVGLSMPC